jgi:hypothetical protein
MEVLAQGVEQRYSGFQLQSFRLPVHSESHIGRAARARFLHWSTRLEHVFK